MSPIPITPPSIDAIFRALFNRSSVDLLAVALPASNCSSLLSLLNSAYRADATRRNILSVGAKITRIFLLCSNVCLSLLASSAPSNDVLMVFGVGGKSTSTSSNIIFDKVPPAIKNCAPLIRVKTA
ncbi:hypothetical protein ACHAWO_000925 [Cyclotella atomus]|uniref:Uncharacterized protein n=1 Tax=Cyclotella atomus TaxID=382360 RepID=A0ABD3NCX0_9STRA